MDGVKRCKKCGKEKPSEDFRAEKRCRDGRSGSCRECVYEREQAWKKANRERVRATFRAWNAEKRPDFAETQREWRRRNPGKNAEYKRKWYANNKDKARAWTDRRRARLAEAFVENVNYHDILKRDAGICGICQEPVGPDFHLDHILPLAAGGTHEPDNVQLAHPLCNLRKWTKTGSAQAA